MSKEIEAPALSCPNTFPERFGKASSFLNPVGVLLDRIQYLTQTKRRFKFSILI